MYRRRLRGCLEVMLAILLYAAGSPFSATHADVTASGLGTVVNQPGAGVFDISGGSRPGNGVNLFHSFGNFSLGAAERANFVNDSGGLATTNILGRVSGGNPSNIFGTIDTTAFPGANLFLMNPAGILFGPTAQLNVDGSFHATTADYIKLGSTGGIFYANAARPTVLRVDAPSAFGFLTANPASIDLRGGLSGLDLTTLAVPEGETLSLVGGALKLGAAEVRDGNGNIVQDAMPVNLLAPGGRVNLVSAASAGEAAFDGTGFSVDGFEKLGDIDITGGDIRIFGGEFVFASFIDGREVFIRGGKLAADNSIISPGGLSIFDPSPDGGGVDIRVSGDVTFTGTDRDFLSNLIPGITTSAGPRSAPELSADVKVPDITIEADGSFTLSGIASVLTQRLGPGAPSAVWINADTVTVKDAASIVSLNFFQGAGGNITIHAREVELSGDGTVSPTGITGISAQNLIHPSVRNLVFPCCADIPPERIFADAGSIRVDAGETVHVSGNALILTDSLGLGRGGDITINAGHLAVVGAGGADTAAIKGQSGLAGNAGNIVINASGTIELRDGAQIAGNTFGSGQSSNITLTAGGAITFTGADSRIANATGPLPLDELNRVFQFSFDRSFETLRDELGLPADADVFDVLGALTGIPGLTAGDAGTLSISTPTLTLNADTRLEMSTGWEGNAGVVQANVGSLFLNNGGAINSRSGIETLSGDVIVGPGNAGAVNLTATDTISISGTGSTISTSTLGDGTGGNIALTAGNAVQILNGGSVSADSLSTEPSAGDTGSITINAGNQIVMTNGSVSTRAITSDGGNIVLNAPNIIKLTNSQITSSVESGVGGGGNISVDPEILILNNSQILANAFGGPGGNINIVAGNFIPTATSAVQASSALSTQGTIVVASPENNVAASIAQLPGDIVDVSGLLPERCAARRAGTSSSSFTVAGRGGLPIDPDGYLPSFSTGMTLPPKSTADASYPTAHAALRSAERILLAMAGPGCTR